MKKLLIALTAVAFLGTTALNAQTRTKSPTSTSKDKKRTERKMKVKDSKQKRVQQQPAEIAIDKLPDPIKKKLKSKDYAKWKPTKAYLTEQEKYLVELTKASRDKTKETQMLMFEKDGTLIK